MSLISKPVDWEIFSIPPIQPIQYYPILKKKREFSQLVSQYDTQVLTHGYLHYCGIVPKNISSSLGNKYELLIVFFDEGLNTSFIGFRIKVSKETFMHESNSLLLFLKKSKNAVFYLMNNNCIYVQCGRNAWELFYLLYDIYLRQYVLTIIGTKFFYHFVYSYCIQKEIQLLELLFKGSKIIRVSKKSIYYKIHRKRKISVTDLIHMTLNMPKSKRYVMSSFKDSVLHLNFRDGNLYNSAGNKIHVSKLVLKKFKNQFSDMSHSAITDHSESSVSKYKAYKADIKTKHSHTSLNDTLKRKFEEIESSENDIQPGPTASKFQKISKPIYHKELNEDQWEQYKNFQPYSVKSYSCILSPTSCFRNSNILNKSSHVMTHQNTSNCIPPNLQMSDSDNESLLPVTPSISCISSSIKISSPTMIQSEKFCQGNVKRETSSDFIFTTAAGSAINLSNTAMLTAHRLIQDVCDENQQNIEEKVTCDVNQRKRFKKTPSFKSNESCKKSTTGSILLDKTCARPSRDVRSLKCGKMTSNKLDAVFSENIHESFGLDNFDNTEDVSFSTAAGKVLTISNTAMQAAHKLIEDVFKQEKVAVNTDKDPATGSCDMKNKFNRNASAFRNIGCPSKSVAEEIDVDMDNTLVEKFFEDTLFDENELEAISECKKDKDINVDLEPNSAKNLPTRKPRKSLGGRRSGRFFSSTH